MNTIATILTAALCSMNLLAAAGPGRLASGDPLKTAIQRELSRHLFFPGERHDLAGQVEVELEAQPDGSLRARVLDAANEALRDFVMERLEKANVDPGLVSDPSAFRFRLVFRRQA